MTIVRRGILGLCLVSLLAVGSAAAESLPAGDRDPVRSVLLESKEKNRGVTIHANGVNISLVVTQVDERYVIGRSQQTSRIVIRLDRIDGVSAMF